MQFGLKLQHKTWPFPDLTGPPKQNLRCPVLTKELIFLWTKHTLYQTVKCWEDIFKKMNLLAQPTSSSSAFSQRQKELQIPIYFGLVIWNCVSDVCHARQTLRGVSTHVPRMDSLKEIPWQMRRKDLSLQTEERLNLQSRQITPVQHPQA